jgi:peptide/nickel transport system permease protein
VSGPAPEGPRDAGPARRRPGAPPRSARWRVFRHRGAIVGGLIIGLYAGTAVLGTWVAPQSSTRGRLLERLSPPSRAHVLGADELGRDVLSRVIVGARVSLAVQAVAVGLALAVGVSLGVLAGYYGRWTDEVVSRAIDLLLAFPGIFLALAIVTVLEPGVLGVMVAAGVVSIPQFARLVRGIVLELTRREFIEATQALGARDLRILACHILPNSLPAVIVQTSLRMGTVLLTASGLGFLGLGVQPPAPEWGAMLANARDYLFDAPHVALAPGLAITLVVIGFNLVGDGLRDLLDPRLRGSL